MRNIGKLVALDWKRIVKSPFAFLLILALVQCLGAMGSLQQYPRSYCCRVFSG